MMTQRQPGTGGDTMEQEHQDHRVYVHASGAGRRQTAGHGYGGWAWVHTHGTRTERCSGTTTGDTNGHRIEVEAALRAVEIVPEGQSATVRATSIYVAQGPTKWMTLWRERNWNSANGHPIRNAHTWAALDAAQNKRKIEWQLGRAGKDEQPHLEEAIGLARERAADARAQQHTGHEVAITITLTASEADALKRIAKAQGNTQTEIARYAISAVTEGLRLPWARRREPRGDRCRQTPKSLTA